MVSKMFIMSEAQERSLYKNSHLKPVSWLDDHDLLVVDTQEAPGEPLGHFGPYILDRDGSIQDVNYHFNKHHNIKCPWAPR